MNPVNASRAYMRRESNTLLLLVCLAQFMVILDVSIVNVALPSIRNAVGFSTTGLQWVVNAYTLTFAGFLLLGGRALGPARPPRVFSGRHGALLGRLAGLRPSRLAGPAARRPGATGVRRRDHLGASLAIITTSFEEGASRNRALGVWGALGGLGPPRACCSAAS